MSQHQVLIHIDESPRSKQLQTKLRNTQQSQAKWLINRMTLNSVSIPIEFINDREYVERNIKAFPDTFKYASAEIRNDKQFIMDVIVKNKNCFSALYEISQELKQDGDFIIGMIKKNDEVLDFADYCDVSFILFHYEYWKEEQEENGYDSGEENDCVNESVPEQAPFDFEVEKTRALQMVNKFYHNYNNVNEILKTDMDVCMACLKHLYGFNYVFQNRLNKENRTLIERATREVSEVAIFYADENLKRDREFVTRLIQINPHVLLFVDKELRKDREIVLEAVKLDIETLNYVSGKLLRDEQFVQLANSVGNHKISKKHESVIIDFMKNCNNNDIRILPRSLRKNRELMINILEFLYPSSLQCMDPSLINKEFVIECINRMKASALEGLDVYLPYGMLNDPELATLLVVNSPGAFRHFIHMPCVSDNRDVVLKVIQGSADQYQYLKDEFKNDKEIARLAAKQAYHILCCSSTELTMDKEFMLECIAMDPEAIKCTDLQYDLDFVLQAVKLNGNVLNYRENSSEEIEIEAVKQNGYYRPETNILDNLLEIRMKREYPDLILKK